jgi:hypothetical protein
MAAAVNPAKRCKERHKAGCKILIPCVGARPSIALERKPVWPTTSKPKSAEKPHVYAAHSRRLFLLYFSVST